MVKWIDIKEGFTFILVPLECNISYYTKYPKLIPYQTYKMVKFEYSNGSTKVWFDNDIVSYLLNPEDYKYIDDYETNLHLRKLKILKINGKGSATIRV
jgi:hypothetical protein